MSKVILNGYIEVGEADLANVRDALPAHLTLTRAEPGCILFEVRESAEQAGRFDVYEEFASQEAFEHHQKRAQQSIWGEVSKNADRHYSIEGLDE